MKTKSFKYRMVLEFETSEEISIRDQAPSQQTQQTQWEEALAYFVVGENEQPVEIVGDTEIQLTRIVSIKWEGNS